MSDLKRGMGCILAGILFSLADSIAYLVFVWQERASGNNFFAYLQTPWGMIFTALWVVSFLLGFAFLHRERVEK